MTFSPCTEPNEVLASHQAYVGRGWTPRDKLYGIVNQSIDPSLGLHEPICILEPSTFDLEVCMILTSYKSFSVTGLHKFFQVLVNYSLGFSGWSDFCFTPKMWRSSVRNIFLMFCLGRAWTPRDELYGIADQLIDSSLALHEPIGIPELSTLDPKMCMIPLVYSTDCFFVTRRYKFLQVLTNYSLSFSAWNDFCFTSNIW